MRASGPGGQSVNSTESAVRVTHFPSGESVVIMDDRSQYRNKERAIEIIQERLWKLERRKIGNDRRGERNVQVCYFNLLCGIC